MLYVLTFLRSYVSLVICWRYSTHAIDMDAECKVDPIERCTVLTISQCSLNWI